MATAARATRPEEHARGRSNAALAASPAHKGLHCRVTAARRGSALAPAGGLQTRHGSLQAPPSTSLCCAACPAVREAVPASLRGAERARRRSPVAGLECAAVARPPRPFFRRRPARQKVSHAAGRLHRTGAQAVRPPPVWSRLGCRHSMAGPRRRAGQSRALRQRCGNVVGPDAPRARAAWPEPARALHGRRIA